MFEYNKNFIQLLILLNSVFIGTGKVEIIERGELIFKITKLAMKVIN